MPNSLLWKLDAVPQIDTMTQLGLSRYFEKDSAVMRGAAFSDRELLALVKESGMDGVLAGRYTLGKDDIELRCRVRTKTWLKEFSATFPLTAAPAKMGELAIQVAGLLGAHPSKEQLAEMKLPDVSGAESFELSGSSSEAYAFDRDKEALDLARKWIRLDPESPAAAYRYCTALWPDSPRGAVKCIQKVLDKRPCRLLYLTMIGDAWWSAGDLKQARVAYQKAVVAGAPGPEPYAALAAIEHKSGHKAEADKLWVQAESHVENWVDHAWLAIALHSQKMYSRAARRYQIAIGLGGPRWYLLYALGWCRYDERNYAAAIQLWKSLAASHPRDEETIAALGVAYGKMQKWPEAERCLRLAIVLDPKDFYPRDNLGWALFNQGKLNEAEKVLLASLQIHPNSKYPHGLLATVYMRQGKPLQALPHVFAASPKARAIGIGLVAAGMLAFCGVAIFLTVVIRRRLAPDGPAKLQ